MFRYKGNFGLNMSHFHVLFFWVLIVLICNKEVESNSAGRSFRFAGIFPGTLWCGDGNMAGNNTSLGIFSGSDRFVLLLLIFG